VDSRVSEILANLSELGTNPLDSIGNQGSAAVADSRHA
jgi:hypothetical protein